MSTSLTLQALLKSTIARAGIGVPGAASVSGLAPAAQALYLAASAHRQAPQPKPGTSGATIVAVVPTDADVERATGDIRFFLAAIEGLSESRETPDRFVDVRSLGGTTYSFTFERPSAPNAGPYRLIRLAVE